MRNPFRYFKTSPEVIRLAVMMYVRFPLSLRQVHVAGTTAPPPATDMA
jgi:transposase-like protein